MQWTWRRGTLNNSALAQLLGFRQAIQWQQQADAQRGQSANIALPNIPPGHWLLPSYSRLDAAYGFRFSLHWRAAADAPQQVAYLASVGETMPSLAAQSVPGVDTPIDAFVSTQTLHDVCLHVTVFLPADGAMPAPVQEWLSCSLRPAQLQPTSGAISASNAVVPAAFSQMLLPAATRQRACSPVTLAMACAAYQPTLERSAFLAAALHSEMFGVWPANIYAASRAGVLAAAELCSHPDDAALLLAAGVQIICSTRWCKGELDDAALAQSDGHLMLLRGLEAGSAWVHDPAAASDAQVPRRYRRDQFCRIWLSERGACYLLLPAPGQPAGTIRTIET